MKRLLSSTLIILLLLPDLAGAAVAYVSSGSADDGAVDTIAFNYDATGTDFILACAVVRDVDTGNTVVSFTYNSVALTLVASAQAETSGGLFHDVHLYRLIAPTTGTNELELVLTNTSDGLILGVMGFSGVHQTVPLNTPDSDASPATTAITSTVSPASAADELVADCFGQMGPGADEVLATGESGQTQRWNDNRTLSIPQGTGSTRAGGVGTVDMTWDWTNFGYFGHIGVSIKPATTAKVGRRRPMVLQ